MTKNTQKVELSKKAQNRPKKTKKTRVKLSPKKLYKLAKQLCEEENPNKQIEIKKLIIRGFYGK